MLPYLERNGCKLIAVPSDASGCWCGIVWAAVDLAEEGVHLRIAPAELPIGLA